MPRVYAYVDGFNLYHRALQNSPQFKWLDLCALVRRLLRPDDELIRLRYFTARVQDRTGPGQAARQESYLRAIAGTGEVTIHMGNFAVRSVCRPLVEKIPLVHPVTDGPQYVMVHNTEEKASDVNLASYLLHDSCRGDFDAAAIISSDTDLVEPLRLVKNYAGRPVLLLYPDITRRSVPNKLANACTLVRFINRSDLTKSQLPNPARARNGQLVLRPAEWGDTRPASTS